MKPITATDETTGTVREQVGDTQANYMEILGCADFETEADAVKALEREEQNLFLVFVGKDIKRI